jgi:hypothetical protein
MVTGVVAGVFAAFVWSAVAGVRRWRRLKEDFSWLSGNYRVTRKLAAESEPETLSITVKGRVLSVQSDPPGDGSYSGRIAMNEELPRSGEGYYSQWKDERLLWGFWNIAAVKEEKKILVHRTYANHKTDTAVVSGFEWERVAR